MQVTWNQFQGYLFVERQLDRSQFSNYKSRFNKINSFFQTREFVRANILEFISTLSYTSATIAQYIFMLKHVATYLKKEDEIVGIKVPKVRNKRNPTLYAEELTTFLNTAYLIDTRYALACEMALKFGLRISEIVMMRRENITGTELILRNTKNGEDVTIYLTQDVIDKIESLKVTSPYVFGRGKVLMCKNSLNSFLRRALKQAGINKYLTFHDLRHSCASDLMDHDVNMYKIKEYMRHKNITTTERYCHLERKALIEVAKKHTLSQGALSREEVIVLVNKFIESLVKTQFKPDYKQTSDCIDIKIPLK